MRAVAERRMTAQFKAGASALAISLFAALAVLAIAALPASAAYLESFGPDGTAGTEFATPAGAAVDQETGAVYVFDSEAAVLYKFDENGDPLEWGGSALNISGNEVTGLAPNSGSTISSEVAVDPETHVVYVTTADKVRAFEADGEPHYFTAGPGVGTSELPSAASLYGLTVDKSGNIYVGDKPGQKVRIYSRSGELVTEFEPKGDKLSPLEPATMAVAPDGTLYVTGFGSRVYAFEPSQFPITSGTTYGLGQPVQQGESEARFPQSVAVDPATEYVYVGEDCNTSGLCQASNASQIEVYDGSDDLIGLIGTEEAGGPGEIRGSAPALGLYGSGKKLYAAVRGEAGGLSQVQVYDSVSFFVGPPTISGVAATDVTSTSAVLRARINPNTLATTYHFEYGTVDCAANPGACTDVPLGGEAIGSGHTPVLVSAEIDGLSPGTPYYYRVVAQNSEPTESPVRMLRTQESAFGFEAMDGRVWEQVTPHDKFGGAVTNLYSQQAAADGSGIAFRTKGSIVEEPAGSRPIEPATNLARRVGAGSWTVADLVPPHTEATDLGAPHEYKIFSPDLGRAVLEPRDATPLSPMDSEKAPHLRINTTPPTYLPLVTGKDGFANVPPDTVFGQGSNLERAWVSVEGADASLDRILLQSKPPLVVGAEEGALYMWHDGTLRPVSELPGDEGGGIVRAQPGSGILTVFHAVSSDGSRVFWAPGDPLAPSVEWPALYLRDTVAEETTRLDIPRPAASGDGEAYPAFMGASVDGSVVFFTDSQQLTADANPKGRDLYRCEIGDVGGSLGCTQLNDLSASLGGSGAEVEVNPLALGMSDDGAIVYFVEDADRDAPKLYIWQQGQGVHFVAALEKGDELNWGRGSTSPVGRASRSFATSSPNGRYLAFMSGAGLAGAETDDPVTGEPVEQVYIYDALAGSLVCASCDASGATHPGYPTAETDDLIDPVGPDMVGVLAGAALPDVEEVEPGRYALYHPRAVLDNGRLFFNSPQPLVSADSNGTWDAYQYEPFGVGSCNAAARRPSIALVEEACVGLLSAGTGDEDSVFLDASETGGDVFIATSDRLSVLDTDRSVDVYDARVGGVAAVAEQHPECLGEACLPPPSPPNDPTPASAAFSGSGNPKGKAVKHCRRGQRKVRHKGKARCVKSRHHGKRHPARGAGR